MRLKYFQTLADIRNHYNDVLRNFDNPAWGHGLLESWGIELNEKPQLEEEMEALRYLVGLQTMLVSVSNAKKPSKEVVRRCLNRHLAFLDKIHHCNASNVNNHKSKLIQTEYKACRHYLFQFSLMAWYEKLPNEILTFENKYPDFKVGI